MTQFLTVAYHFLANILLRAALVLYEHLITMGDEIRLIWLQTPSYATVLYLGNRYLNLCVILFEVITTFVPVSDKVLDSLLRSSMPVADACFVAGVRLFSNV